LTIDHSPLTIAQRKLKEFFKVFFLMKISLVFFQVIVDAVFFYRDQVI
jgi:hypothetical protein